MNATSQWNPHRSEDQYFQRRWEEDTRACEVQDLCQTLNQVDKASILSRSLRVCSTGHERSEESGYPKEKEEWKRKEMNGLSAIFYVPS